MKRFQIAAMLLFCGCTLGAVEAKRSGPSLVPGRWEITWLEPGMTPATRAIETRITRCYSQADAARGANIVMPAAQEQRCKTTSSMIGGDVTFDTQCPDADHRLRSFVCGPGLCGVYRYVPHGKQPILESIVIPRRVDRPCDAV